MDKQPEKAPMSKEHIFTAAYDDYSEAIFRFCYLKTSDRELAKDLMQQAFTKAWAHMVDENHAGQTIDNMRAFIYRIANNLIIDWYRKKKESSLDNLMDEGFDPKDMSMQTDTYAETELIMRSLDQLEERDKNIIIWKFIEDLPYTEIAKLAKESPGIISVRIYRALKRLKKILHTEDIQTKKRHEK